MSILSGRAPPPPPPAPAWPHSRRGLVVWFQHVPQRRDSRLRPRRAALPRPSARVGPPGPRPCPRLSPCATVPGGTWLGCASALPVAGSLDSAVSQGPLQTSLVGADAATGEAWTCPPRLSAQAVTSPHVVQAHHTPSKHSRCGQEAGLPAPPQGHPQRPRPAGQQRLSRGRKVAARTETPSRPGLEAASLPVRDLSSPQSRLSTARSLAALPSRRRERRRCPPGNPARGPRHHRRPWPPRSAGVT